MFFRRDNPQVSGPARHPAVRLLWLHFLWLIALLAIAPATQARVLTDLAGREISVPEKVDRILLGEGRFLTALAILEREAPLARVVGMQGEFKRLDPAGYAQFRERFPVIDEIPRVGQLSPASFSVERAIALAPDVAFFGLEGHGPSPDDREVVDRLEQAGVTVVFIDFRREPVANTPPSIELMGAVLGREPEAMEFVEAYRHELARVSNGLAGIESKPDVFIENRVGLSQECCDTMADGMMGRFIALAGGHNIATALIPGTHGTLSLEYLLGAQPDLYIGTAIGSPESAADSGRIILGAGVTPELARRSLARALDRPGIRELQAVRDGHAYAVWHHFYNSPLNVAAVQVFAKWIHPEAFRDLDPADTLRRFHERFQPFPAEGTYWTGQP